MTVDISPLELITIGTNPASHYHRFFIPKRSGGKREINAPSETLKAIQRKILQQLVYTYRVHHCAHGFVADRNIRTCAEPHIGAKCVVNIDIKDFFPSTRASRVADALGLNPEMSDSHRLLLNILCLNGGLPQGAPTSPALSNIVFFEIDNILSALAKEHDVVYTRYADDLTFSSRNTKEATKMIPIAINVLKKFGYEVNPDKIKVMRPHRRMEITGVCINPGYVSVPRKKRRILRARVHKAKLAMKQGVPPEQLRAEVMWIKGYWSFIHMVNPEQAKKFKKDVDALVKYVSPGNKRGRKKKQQ